MKRCSLLAARCALSAKSVVPELILFGHQIPVDSHRAGGGRNWDDPVTRHRNTGRCSKRVAYFLRRLHNALWVCRDHYVFVRISKCRCAKCEREHDTRASNRRTAQATKHVFHSHAMIVIPFRILGKLIWRLCKTKKRHFQHWELIRPKDYSGRSRRGSLSRWNIVSQFGCIHTLKRKLHRHYEESEQLFAQDLPLPKRIIQSQGTAANRGTVS